jgi:hypothetical protein
MSFDIRSMITGVIDYFSIFTKLDPAQASLFYSYSIGELIQVAEIIGDVHLYTYLVSLSRSTCHLPLNLPPASAFMPKLLPAGNYELVKAIINDLRKFHVALSRIYPCVCGKAYSFCKSQCVSHSINDDSESPVLIENSTQLQEATLQDLNVRTQSEITKSLMTGKQGWIHNKITDK